MGALSTQTSTKSALKAYNPVFGISRNTADSPEDSGLGEAKTGSSSKKDITSLSSSRKSRVSVAIKPPDVQHAEAEEPGSDWTVPDAPVLSVKRLSVALNITEDYEGQRAARAAAATYAVSHLDQEAAGGDISEQMHRSRRSNATTQKSIHFNEEQLVQMQSSESTLTSLTLDRAISLRNSSLSLNSMDSKPSSSTRSHKSHHRLTSGAVVPLETSLSALPPGRQSNKPVNKNSKLISAPSMAVLTAGLYDESCLLSI
jgi:hypothetical protein